jgi:transcriptional regulator with XRE-family HTH domain
MASFSARAFASRLRADREKAGLTIRELADQVGISFAYVSRFEVVGTGPHLKPKIIFALAKALGADELEYLHLSGTVPAPLKPFISDAEGRAFVRAVAKAKPRAGDWDRLAAALGKSGGKKSKAKKKSR